MQIAIIAGSHRKDSQSSRVGAYIAKDLARIDSSVTVDTIDLAGNALPLWDESVWQQLLRELKRPRTTLSIRIIQNRKVSH